jgi:hypothetical protein
VLAAMARQDRRRSAVLNAIEKRAVSAFGASTSIQNYFEVERQRTQRAHKFR